MIIKFTYIQEELSMDYAALYQKKLTSAAEAVKVVKSGDWVDYVRYFASYII